jgi:hypothetical protein
MVSFAPPPPRPMLLAQLRLRRWEQRSHYPTANQTLLLEWSSP